MQPSPELFSTPCRYATCLGGKQPVDRICHGNAQERPTRTRTYLGSSADVASLLLGYAGLTDGRRSKALLVMGGEAFLRKCSTLPSYTKHMHRGGTENGEQVGAQELLEAGERDWDAYAAVELDRAVSANV